MMMARNYSITTNQFQKQVPRIAYEGNFGNTSLTSYRSRVVDVCILEDDISTSRTIPPMSIQDKFLTQGPAFDERTTYNAALQVLSQRTPEEANPPDGALVVPLLKHQRIALSWMVRKELTSIPCSGGILADDQGLGKTVSTIALILTEKRPYSPGKLIEPKPEAFSLDEDEDEMVVENASMRKGRPDAGTLVVCPVRIRI